MPTNIDTTTQWFGSGGTQVEVMDTWCLHTTEGSSWPDYQGGSIAPNETIMPNPGIGITVRRHYPETASSMALENRPGGVETNRAGVNQTELVGTCVQGGPGYYWPAADDVVLKALADYKRPFLAKYGIPHAGPAFAAYPASYGKTAGRMTFGQWAVFRGICGHQHVPENDHGDPGAFPLARLVAFFGGAPTTPPPPHIPHPPAPTGRVVLAVDGTFGPQTRMRLQQWAGAVTDSVLGPLSWRAIQRKLGGIAVDGAPGHDTWTRLQQVVGAPVDGIPGPRTYAALQTYLNQH